MNLELLDKIVMHFKNQIVQQHLAVLNNQLADEVVLKNLSLIRGYKAAVQQLIDLCIKDGKVPSQFFVERGMITDRPKDEESKTELNLATNAPLETSNN